MPPRRNTSKASRPSVRRPVAFRQMSLSHPPPVHPQLQQSIRLRFSSTGAINATITWKNLLDTINFAASAVTAYALFDMVKIDSIEVWSNPAIGAASAYIAVQFPSIVVGQAGDGRVFQDSSMGIEPAHVRCRPNVMSQNSQWQIGSANTAFQLTCPTASVVDVSLSFREISDIPPVLTTNAPVGAAPGNLYFRGLDGQASAGTSLPAQAMNTD
jgi:hypothetical protein